MIGEWLTHLTTPCRTSFRRMGYLSELIAIGARHRRCRASWQIHLAASRALILDAVEACERRGRAVVLGSGPLFDIPLAELSARFATVVLVDVCHLRATRRRAGRYANVELVERDVSGVAERLYEQRGRRAGLTLPSPRPDRGVLAGADLTVSANLLSQLPLVPLDFLASVAPDLPREERDGFARSIIDHHLRLLQGQPGSVCLITETMRVIADGDTVIEKVDPLFGAPLAYQGRKWWWEMAPRPEISRKFDVRLRILGVPDLSAAPTSRVCRISG